MKAASQTALKVAILRALHQIVDIPPIFIDPLAARILGPEGMEHLEAERINPDETARLRGTRV